MRSAVTDRSLPAPSSAVANEARPVHPLPLLAEFTPTLLSFALGYGLPDVAGGEEGEIQGSESSSSVSGRF